MWRKMLVMLKFGTQNFWKTEAGRPKQSIFMIYPIIETQGTKPQGTQRTNRSINMNP